MSIRTTATIVLLLVLVAGAGCINTTDSSGEPTNSIRLQLDHSQTDSNYRITGDIVLQLLGAEQEFERVMICAYTEEGELLAAETAGDMEPVSTAAVNITTVERPTYVVVDHPHFREFDPGFQMIDWRDGLFRDEAVRSPEDYIDEFEYVPPTEPGECGTTQPVEG